MAKSNFLAGLKAAITPAVPDWSARIGTAQAELAAALDAHGRAALASQQELPGANVRLTEAVQRLQEARTKLETLQAAQRAWEAQEAERHASAAAAEAGRQDKAALAAFDHLTTVAKEGEPVLAAYEEWWVKLLAADEACRIHFAENPRLRPDLAGYSLADLVSREITRQASAKPLPPCANALAAELSDRRAWEPLSAFFTALANVVLPATAKGKARAA